MEDLVTIREKINQMAELSLFMLKTTFDGFMKHDLDILAGVLKDEQKLNDMERTITLALVEISKEATAVDKKKIMLLTDMVEDLEEIGDYIKDMIERIEIKIQERLLFSEEGLSEYKHLYTICETALIDVVNALKMNDENFAKRALCDPQHMESLIQKYRTNHTQRLMLGICDPRAGNMFLNLLDFTAQIFYHTTAIAKNILELK
ncbi:MAG: hypothetical protein NC928_03085 [Candidatus Omnitrophica bacterium]|nr:hypothetical protein [Candidatus Omnitrophota bacterium]